MHASLMMPVHTALGSTALRASSGASAAQASPKLVRAAHEFEGMLMEELLKPLATGGVPGDDEDDDGSNSDGLGSAGAVGSFAVDSLAQAISQHGGFGIADKLIAQLSQREATESSKSGNTTELTREVGKETGRAKIKPLK
jgi:Rod binding domain-containing protein